MMVRQEQVNILEESMLQNFRKRLRLHLRETFPDQTKDISDDGLFTIIDAEVERGRGYNITTQRAAMLFTDLRFFQSQYFEDAPEMSWAKAILENSEIEGEVKLRLIYECLASSEGRDDYRVMRANGEPERGS